MTTQTNSLPTARLKDAEREGGVHTIGDLRGPAGRLEALLNPGRLPVEAPVSVLMCHPHPLFGGTLHNKVVYHAMKTFTDLGLPVLRFNFRGTGLSEGTHDHGRGEQEDAHSGIDWLAQRYGKPVIAAGFSFGAHMALRAGAHDARVPGMVSLGTPIEAGDRSYTYEFLESTTKPILFMSGSADSFSPMDKVELALEPVRNNSSLVWIAGADHFFAGKLEFMQSALRGWMEAHFVSPALAQATRPISNAESAGA